ncbi:shikimate dehydrogenase [Kocuria sp.]|uniref:shikimate dehydrogenase n=1 Tax=Kocuria sp. TaxID=1871328 RepID=UPI0026E07B95|nr:shikimate dehydrogenase [Kocuria sp.]MDO5617657.1 shikimate dehydrogenase [Kocuria sp.]
MTEHGTSSAQRFSPEAATPYAGVVGHPISHSRSPQLHRTAYALLGELLDYGATDVEETGLVPRVEQLRHDPLWRGLSVTMPLKSEAAEIADELTDLAEAVGVVNTLVHHGDGHVLGHNTDVAGIMGALRAAGHIPPVPRAAILGGGGTATAAVAALQGLGATSVDAWVRSEARAHRTVTAAEHLGLPLQLKPWEQAAEHVAGYDVVVATLPPHGCDDLAAAFAAVRGRHTTGVLLDAAYDPWPSAIARAWTRAGGQVAPGIDMLIFQAVDQIKLFTKRPLDVDLPREATVINAMCEAVGRPALAADR